MYFDGSLKHDGGGAGVLFISPKGEQLKYVFQILFKFSNNEAEYEALLHGLRLAVSLGIKRLLVYGDSLLVVQQVNKEWDINKNTMDAYVEEIRKLETSSQDWKSTTSIATTTLELMSSPNLDLLEQWFHREFLSMNFITHRSRYKANKPLTRRPWPQSEKY